ncbi:GATA zinc finger domain-containing protein 14 [Drosophila serrata]|uniref:GATA zinc finger domain-containing protein 14 n=1 Tax=Drosophila serrata TaxID=7274 RepID=UPI000A1D2C5A|nr:GATA zinc finger domain-containing protein 14 [Drosophila serrata]
MNSLSVKLSLPTRVQPEVMPQPGMAGVYTNQLHYFKKHFLDELTKKKFASDFMNPVDTEELQIPQYYTVIHRPMDVGTITKRVENNYYHDVDEAISDFHLLLRNCYMFNGVDTVVYRKGIQLEKFFQRVIKNIPQGPPVPCNKDPMATCKLKINPMAASVEQECRNQLRKLQTFTNQAEATARNFFGPKWNSFSAKLDKQFFKSLEEFRFHVDGMFKKYHDQAKTIYEKVYDQPGGYQVNNNSISHSSVTSNRSTSDSYITISRAEATDLMRTFQFAQNSLTQCMKQPHKVKALVETLCNTIGQFKVKLEVIETAIATQDTNMNIQNSTIVQEKEIPAGLYLPTEGLEFLVDTPDAGLSEDDPKLEPIDQDERRHIQMLFCTLPGPAMREICGIVHANEVLISDNNGAYNFDLNNFELVNAQIMKAAVARALKLNGKIYLPPDEMDNAGRLGHNRRKSSGKNNYSFKANGNQCRGKKRSKSADYRSDGETSLGGEIKRKTTWLNSNQNPNIPELPIDIYSKGHKSGKSKKEGHRVPESSQNPYGKFPISAGGPFNRKASESQDRMTQSKGNLKLVPPEKLYSENQWTHTGERLSRCDYPSRGRGRGGVRLLPPEPLAKTEQLLAKFKALVDSSTDDDDDEYEVDNVYNNYNCQNNHKNNNNNNNNKSSAMNSKNQSNPKNPQFLASGNVLTRDLSLSSSSSSDEN